MEKSGVIDVDEINVLTIDDELSRPKFIEVLEDEREDQDMKIIKVESATCIIPSPIEASQAFHLLSW